MRAETRRRSNELTSEATVRSHETTNRSTLGVVLVVSTAAFLASLDLFMVNIAFPRIRSMFGADLAAMSWILHGYTVVFAAFLNPAGTLGDRYGHRRIFLAGLVVFMLGSLGCGGAMSLAMLVAARVVQAVGAAMLMPSSLALLMAACRGSARRRREYLVGRWCDGCCARTARGGCAGRFLLGDGSSWSTCLSDCSRWHWVHW